MNEYTIKDKVAVVGLGETKYYRRGQAPVSEFRLACEAILKAANDAGIDVRDIDGISGYANDRNDASRLATALGLKQMSFAGMVWGGGGGGGSAAVGNAASALVAGYAKYVVAFRALAQGQFGRFGQAPVDKYVSGAGAYTAPYGLYVPAQWVALRTRRFMNQYGINQ
jgi:acetyl-CoA acetyltransferase